LNVKTLCPKLTTTNEIGFFYPKMKSIPYSQLARIYDKVMSHVNYKMWTSYVKNLFQFADHPVKSLVDLSCGTGKHLTFFAKSKIALAGSDKSLAMLQTAKRKPALKSLPLFTGDVSHIALKSELFDAAIMLYDSINYILQDDQMEKMFDEVSRILKPGGLFIFDVVTEQGLKHCFEDHYESNSWNGLAYQRRSWFDAVKRIQHNEFLFLYNGESHKEEHIQLIRERDEWIRLVEKSRMKLIQEFSNFTFLPADRKSERIHYICKKERR
jgi:ubiquinone/menaquinone biosynthesis C-methylase UbiE